MVFRELSLYCFWFHLDFEIEILQADKLREYQAVQVKAN